MQFLAIFLFYAACVFVLIVVHETGHYLAGLVAGIPARDMRLRLLAFPQQVVLRDGDEWVSPTADIERYVALTWRLMQTKPRVYLYVLGGMLVETLFTTAVGVGLLLAGQPRIAFAVVGMSLLMGLPWLVIDTVAVCRGKIVGDLSGLWFLARLPTAVFVTAFLTVRLALLWSAKASGG